MVNSNITPIDPYEDPLRKGGSIQTFTGHVFHPLNPREDDIFLVDVAHALGNKARFTGHTRRLYSTAEQVSGFLGFLRGWDLT